MNSMKPFYLKHCPWVVVQALAGCMDITIEVESVMFCHRPIFYVEVKRPAFYILYSANIAGNLR